MRRNSGLVVLPILLAMCSAGQVPDDARLTMFLPAEVSSQNIELQYVLYGAFGASGGSIRPNSDSKFIEIPLSAEKKPASEIKVFAWGPGCGIGTFDIALHGLDTQETYVCHPQRTITLVGQVKDTALLRRKSAEIRIDYLAGWACQFFGFADCQVPQISLGVSKIDPDGRFEAKIPDFTDDATASNSQFGSEFQFVLREVKTWNVVAFLTPETITLRSPGRGLKPTSSYPDPTVFVAQRNH